MKAIFTFVMSLLAVSALASEQDRFAWFSCEDRIEDLTIAQAILDLNVNIVITQGDTPYTNFGPSLNRGRSVEPVRVDSTASGSRAYDFNSHYENMMSNPGWQALVSGSAEILAQFDDHEWGGDNWSHNLITSELQVPIGATTQAEVNYHWRQGREAWQNWANAYSDNAGAVYDVQVNSEIPSGALTGNGNPSQSDYPITYFRKTFGDIEFIALDTISYRDYSQNSAPLHDVTLLGAQQKAWLVSRVNASSAKFVVIASSKKLGTSGTTDSWLYFLKERNEILSGISRTGIVWISGDHHWPMVARQNNSDANKWSNVSVGNAGVLWSTQPPMSNAAGTVLWASDGVPGATDTNLFGYGFVENGQLHLQIRSDTNAIYYHGFINEESNEIVTLASVPALDTDADGIPDYEDDKYDGSLGDVNGDGRANVLDLLVVQQALTGDSTLSYAEKIRADIYPDRSGDGKFTFHDYSLLTKAISHH